MVAKLDRLHRPKAREEAALWDRLEAAERKEWVERDVRKVVVRKGWEKLSERVEVDLAVMPPTEPLYFNSTRAMREWLEANHATAAELWVGIYKKAARYSFFWMAAADPRCAAYPRRP